ncbi:unnamed protein product [Sphagnum jensenii]|uniref:Uncharacterized protein n=1 Tax=Sphagnum jensenii TaxID=128206 RepID=A0ABP1B4I2_9BRYO
MTKRKPNVHFCRVLYFRGTSTCITPRVYLSKIKTNFFLWVFGACQPCFCDCTHSSDLLTTMPISDCIKDDPQMQKELDKSQIQLLKEELKLQEEVNKEAQQRAELAYLDAKKISSQYQKEAEKCNTGMETSEEARERAEAELVVERKRTVLWERRARAMGWKGKDDPEVVSWEPIGKS